MIRALDGERNVRVVIRRITIHSTSSIDARRLADGLLPALERALARDAASPNPLVGLRPNRDRIGTTAAAEAIVTAISARLEALGQ